MNEMFKFIDHFLAALGAIVFLILLLAIEDGFLLSYALQLVLDFIAFGCWVLEFAISMFEIDGTLLPVGLLSLEFGTVQILRIELTRLNSLALLLDGHVHLSGKPK